jgi:hypothetical protein
MTDTQKYIITQMLDGCTIYGSQHGFRLRDEKNNVIGKVNPRTWRQIKRLLRKDAKGLFVINKNAVRALHGGSWIKKLYKEQLKSKNETISNKHRCSQTSAEETQPGGKQQICSPCTFKPLL